MTDIRDILDYDLLCHHQKNGIVNAQFHPEFPSLTIANYSQECVFSRTWDDVTTKTRGLIWDNYTYEVLARPFEKFWSKEQAEGFGIEIPWDKPYRIFDKADGSLGIGYWLSNGQYAIATRGSFTSDQAVHATEVWRREYKHLTPRTTRTPLFEIIYPSNRIVLDYSGMDDLIYLGCVDISSGENFGPDDWFFGPRVDWYQQMEAERSGKEGYVLYWPHNGFRLKVKHEEYLRIHRMIFGANTKTVWRSLMEGHDPLTIEGLPDEFMPAIEDLVAKFRSEFEKIELQTVRAWRAILPMPTRKDQARQLASHPSKTVASAVFKLLDGKDYDEVIWKALEPERAEPIW